MITKEEWARLKENEKYAMLGQLFKRVEELERKVTKLEKHFLYS